ncbi:MAG: hypothetical protein QS748_13225 [Candidatus Endonucleobacter bathymodioli]|uniref:Uncharacterized protein n=1 Tax=Candidatus Endonucleibacter bathymodioli TaxID=539814 RepID=A0AA90SUA5_9GAMM|nr:hypothetical protein [Candidatus Endonucleobacter bathymodioli]
MKYIILLFFISIFTLANAKNICPISTDIPEYIRSAESFYNKENAESAIEFLSTIVKHNISSGGWVEVPNALKTIDGFIQKKQCLNSNGYPDSQDCFSFCKFLELSYPHD